MTISHRHHRSNHHDHLHQNNHDNHCNDGQVEALQQENALLKQQLQNHGIIPQVENHHHRSWRHFCCCYCCHRYQSVIVVVTILIIIIIQYVSLTLINFSESRHQVSHVRELNTRHIFFQKAKKLTSWNNSKPPSENHFIPTRVTICETQSGSV